jgi:hypothetical protein
MTSNLLSKDKNENRDAPCWLPTQPSVGRVELAIKYEKDPNPEQLKVTCRENRTKKSNGALRLCRNQTVLPDRIFFRDNKFFRFYRFRLYHCHRGWDAVHSTIDTGASTFLLRQLFTQVIIDVGTFVIWKRYLIVRSLWRLFMYIV